MSRQRRIQAAQQTLEIQQTGTYWVGDKKVDFREEQQLSEQSTLLLTPEQGEQAICDFTPTKTSHRPRHNVVNQSVTDVIYHGAPQENLGVLNFASAVNPGGDFLEGHIAQEQILAFASGLYSTQLTQPVFYEKNREYPSAMYTDYGIYSPKVVFFREDSGRLRQHPVTASVLTLPAVNYRQVRMQGEDQALAQKKMVHRMKLVLAHFAAQGDTRLILGAFGAGVFGNAPEDVARWWEDLLFHQGWGQWFEEIVFAVFDSSRDQQVHHSFARLFGKPTDR